MSVWYHFESPFHWNKMYSCWDSQNSWWGKALVTETTEDTNRIVAYFYSRYTVSHFWWRTSHRTQKVFWWFSWVHFLNISSFISASEAATRPYFYSCRPLKSWTEWLSCYCGEHVCIFHRHCRLIFENKGQQPIQAQQELDFVVRD